MNIIEKIEKIVAWFMSWAVWNPTFAAESIKRSVATLKNFGENTVNFWKEFLQMVSNNAWLSCLGTILAMLALLLLIIMLMISVVVFALITLIYLTPIGVFSAWFLGYGLVKAIENDTFGTTKKFFRRVSWAFRTTWKEENTKKRKEKKKKQFRVIEGGRKAS